MGAFIRTPDASSSEVEDRDARRRPAMSRNTTSNCDPAGTAAVTTKRPSPALVDSTGSPGWRITESRRFSVFQGVDADWASATVRLSSPDDATWYVAAAANEQAKATSMLALRIRAGIIALLYHREAPRISSPFGMPAFFRNGWRVHQKANSLYCSARSYCLSWISPARVCSVQGEALLLVSPTPSPLRAEILDKLRHPIRYIAGYFPRWRSSP